MSSLFGAPGPYGLEPPLKSAPKTGKPTTPMKCIHCGTHDARRLAELGIFGFAIAYCSIACASREGVDCFLRNIVPKKCDFCGTPLDYFHSCTVCDEAYRTVELVDEVLDANQLFGWEEVDHAGG